MRWINATRGRNKWRECINFKVNRLCTYWDPSLCAQSVTQIRCFYVNLSWIMGNFLSRWATIRLWINMSCILLFNDGWGERKLSRPIREIIPAFTWDAIRITSSQVIDGKSRTLEQQSAIQLPPTARAVLQQPFLLPSKFITVLRRICHTRLSSRVRNGRVCDSKRIRRSQHIDLCAKLV
jgi:hypothetical protein